MAIGPDAPSVVAGQWCDVASGRTITAGAAGSKFVESALANTSGELRGLMINRWIGDIALLFQAKIGVTSALIVWAGVVVIASLTAFAFLCVSGYDWLSLQLGAAFAGLAMASVFLVIALIGAAFCATSRRRAKQRAMLARAARARGLTPRLLSENCWRYHASWSCLPGDAS